MRNPERIMRGAVNDSATGRDDLREPRVQLESLLLGLQMAALEMAQEPNPMDSVDALALRLGDLYRRSLRLAKRLAEEREAMDGHASLMVLGNEGWRSDGNGGGGAS